MATTTAAPMDVDQEQGIDEGLYSRQLYVMGHDAQQRMGTADVLLVGLDGLGVEIAKNLVLAGVKSVTLHDTTPATYMDLGAQFYLTEQDLGQARATRSAARLSELNPYVQVRTHDGKLDEAFLAGFRCVVLVNASLEEALRIDAICHRHSIGFIKAEARGVFGAVFCDFGDKFVVSDRDGEQPATCLVSSISNTVPPVVTVHEDARHGLETGDYVTFRELAGMPFLNESTPRRITVTGPYAFSLDTDGEGDEKQFLQAQPCDSGYVTQEKMPLTLQFEPLVDAIRKPGEFLVSDFAKCNRSELLHVAFQALDKFQKLHDGAYPRPGSVEDANEVQKLAADINSHAASQNECHVEHIDDEESKKIIRALAFGATGVISPMAAFLGGVVGQEALKACCGKFTPIHQFFYFDAVECLPAAVFSGASDEFQPQGDRYDAQVVVFGRQLQEKIKNVSLFLVGAGAIGCEMLKNWAMMGVACSPDGSIHITDMDTIEKSNLNRQFLFRSKDVQQPKSTVAARAIKAMNPEIHVQSFVSRVGPETEAQFNDDFFDSLSGVCTALDNVEARLYMDQRCLFYGLPMFESGTLGTKGNTQVVVPHKTENYGASRDPPEKSIPICTLKNFPNAIEHTLQWARDWFEGEFFQLPSDVNQYLAGGDFLKQLAEQANTKQETLERLKLSLVDDKPLSFEECITWARRKFEDLYANQIKQLLHNFPLDQLTTTGTPFWSGPKRPPTPIKFDPNDPLHMDFVVAVANTRAGIYGLKGHSDRAAFAKVLSGYEVPAFAPREGVKIAVSEEEEKTDNNRLPQPGQDQSTVILEQLPQPASLAGYRMAPVEFDKDNDAHMQVIVAVSNLRARNYKIPEADMHRSRFIAGKIIPAIATTTALVTGLVCFEFLKVFDDKPLEMFKCGFVNLALPLFAFSEPIPPQTTTTTVKGKEWKWTAWDRIDMDIGDVTLKEFLAHFSAEYDAEISMLSYGATMLYTMFSQRSRSKERMALKMSDLVRTVTKKPLDPSCKFLILEVCATDADDEDLELPYIRFRLRA